MPCSERRFCQLEYYRSPRCRPSSVTESNDRRKSKSPTPAGLRSQSPLRYFADLVLGAFGWRRGIERDAARFLTRLLETNTSRVVSDVEHRLDIARGELEVEIRERLAGVLAVAEAELGEVRRIKEAGEAEVARELNSLKSFENELASIAVASRRQPAVPSVG